MALNVGFGKKEFNAMILIVICFVAFESAMILPMFSMTGEGNYELEIFSNKLAAYGTNSDFGPPTTKATWCFYTLSLSRLFENKSISVVLTLNNCILKGVVTYQRGVTYVTDGDDVSHVRAGDALDGTLVDYGTATTFVIQTPEQLTNKSPYVIMVAVSPMGWDNAKPICSVLANLIFL